MKNYIFALIAATCFFSSHGMEKAQTQGAIEQLQNINFILELNDPPLQQIERKKLMNNALEIQGIIGVIGTEQQKQLAETLINDITQLISKLSQKDLEVKQLIDDLTKTSSYLKETVKRIRNLEKTSSEARENMKNLLKKRFEELEANAYNLIEKAKKNGIEIANFEKQIEKYKKEKLDIELMEIPKEKEEEPTSGTVEELRKQWDIEYPDLMKK